MFVCSHFCLQIKAIAVDEGLTVVSEENVRFDTDLPEFGYVNCNRTVYIAF